MLKIRYGLLDVTAADDAISRCNDAQPFSDVQATNTPDLDSLPVNPWATLELNQWTLDGTKKEWPDRPKDENFGLWSRQMSDENGRFDEPIALTIEFTERHTSEGLTVSFRADSGDYPSDMQVEYYRGEELILFREYKPDATVYFAEGQAEDYTRIVMIFRGTNLPHRYLKLTEIKYGSIKVFDENSIISADIYEEVDRTGAELSINTLEFMIHTEDFQLLDPTGIYKMLQQKQAITAAQYNDDGTVTDFGTFFLEEPSSEDDDTTTLSCVDFLGVIDKTDFMGGIYVNKNAGELWDEIMASAEVAENEHEITEELRNKSVTGWIPICSHRAALQQWAFAVGAVVDCSRGKQIRAYKPETESCGTITHDDKFMGHSVKLKALVTGVTVTTHKYVPESDVSTAFEGTLSAGTHVVTFGSPYAGITVSGAQLISGGENHAVVEVSAAGDVIISGKKYEDSTGIVGVYATDLPANAKPNVVSVSDEATLVNAENARAIAQRLFDYYQNRYTDEGEIILTNQQAGQIWNMNSLNGRDLLGSIDSMEIDLMSETAKLKFTGISVARG